MKKPVKIILISLSILIACAVSFMGGAAIAQKGASIGSDTYESLKLFSDVLAIVQKSYVEDVKVEDIVNGAVKGMLDSLDPHSAFLTQEMYRDLQVETSGSFGGLGIEISVRDEILTVVSPIEDTPAYKAGLQAGDKILKIDDKSSKGLTVTNAVKKLRGPKGTKVKLTIWREGFKEPKDFIVVRDIIEIKSVKSKKLEDKLGYIRVTQFQERTSDDLKSALKKLDEETGGLKGLVLDLRNNPGGLLDQAVNVADLFIESGLIVYTDGKIDGSKLKFYAHKNQIKTDYPIVVLVNEGSASASEIVAGALQDHSKAVILGTKTFGKGSVQTIIPMDNGSALRLTTARYFTPKGKSIQAKGIEPDIEVPDNGITGATSNQKLKIIREEDLERHLENKIETPSKDKKGKPSVEVPKFDEKAVNAGKEKKDIQLERAIDILKSVQVFKKILNKAS